jgi:hypothetical protein
MRVTALHTADLVGTTLHNSMCVCVFLVALEGHVDLRILCILFQRYVSHATAVFPVAEYVSAYTDDVLFAEKA